MNAKELVKRLRRGEILRPDSVPQDMIQVMTNIWEGIREQVNGQTGMVPMLFIVPKNPSARPLTLLLADGFGSPEQKYEMVHALGWQFGKKVGIENIHSVYMASESWLRDPDTIAITDEVITVSGLRVDGVGVVAFQEFDRDSNACITLRGGTPMFHPISRENAPLLSEFFRGAAEYRYRKSA